MVKTYIHQIHIELLMAPLPLIQDYDLLYTFLWLQY
jgi:hypothetical protein